MTNEVYVSSRDGLMRFELRADGSLGNPQILTAEKLGWFDIDKTHGRLYAVTTLDEGEQAINGAAASFQLDDGRAPLRPIDQAATSLRRASYLSVDRTGTMLFLAQFNDRTDKPHGIGSLTVYALGPEGRIGKRIARFEHPGRGKVLPRQAASHPHSCLVDPTNRYLAVGDLGIDKVIIYRIDAENQTITFASEIAAEPGKQPRHVAFSPDSRFLYVMNEGGRTVTGIAFDAKDGSGRIVQEIPRLPEGYTGGSAGADLVMHPTGKFLYGSNRTIDNIVSFQIDEATGSLTLAGHAPTGGESTRSLAISRDGQWLLAANQATDNLRTYAIDAATGRLEFTGYEQSVTRPACVKSIRRATPNL